MESQAIFQAKTEAKIFSIESGSPDDWVDRRVPDDVEVLLEVAVLRVELHHLRRAHLLGLGPNSTEFQQTVLREFQQSV